MTKSSPTFSPRFFLKGSRDAEGLDTVQCIVHSKLFDEEQHRFKMDVCKIDPLEWNYVNKLPTVTSPAFVEIGAFAAAFSRGLQYLSVNNERLTRDALKHRIKVELGDTTAIEGDAERKYFIPFAKRHLADNKSQYKHSTLLGYYSYIRKMEKYFGKDNPRFKDFTHNRIGNIQNPKSLVSFIGDSVNAYQVIKFVKTILNAARRQELTTIDPSVISYSYTPEKKEKRLSDIEVNLFLNAPQQRKKENQQALDLFRMMLLTGLRHSDVIRVSPENDKGQYLKVQVLKNRQQAINTGRNIQYAYPIITPEVREILTRYNGTLPNISLDRFNRLLQKVAKSIKIAPARAEVLTSHWGRHTYIKRSTLTEDVKSITTGHAGDIPDTYNYQSPETILTKYLQNHG